MRSADLPSIVIVQDVQLRVPMEDEEDVRRVRAALQIKGTIHWSVLHNPHFCVSKVQSSNFQYKTAIV